MSISVQIEPIDIDPREEAEDVIERVIRRAEPIARQLAPIDTGRLRGSIDSGRKSLGAYADYAYWVHEGTSSQMGVPFLQRAIEIAEDEELR